jgi:preprotein translocase subunit SecG
LKGVHPVNNVLLVLALLVWAVSAVGLIIFVLLHSGKGTGLSEMFGSTMSPTATGTCIIEKNLDRITIGFAVAFMVSLLVLMVVYPTGM